MEELIIAHLLKLLKDVSDVEWKQRIIDSVIAVEYLYNINFSLVEINRKWVSPDKLWVATIDELDLPEAHKSIQEHGITPPPVTVLQKDGSFYLFMGSVRALVFTLSMNPVDSLVLNISRAIKSAIPVEEAMITVSDFIYKNPGKDSPIKLNG